VAYSNFKKLEIYKRKTKNSCRHLLIFYRFHVASRYGHLPIVEKLLDYGADVNQKIYQYQ
jgi:hypothetical protein